MSNFNDADRPEEQAPIQIDIYGVKVQGRPEGQEYRPPKSVGELADRLKQHVMTIVDLVVGIPARTLAAVDQGIDCLGRWFVRKNAQSHHDEADKREDARQETLPQAAGSPQPALPAPNIEGPFQALEDLLNEYRARGLGVEVSDLGDGRLGLYILPPETIDAAAELVEQELRRLPGPETSPDPDPATERPLVALGLSPRVQHLLEKSGIRTVGDLVAKTEGEIISIPGIGEKAIQEILRRGLGRLGLNFREDR